MRPTDRSFTLLELVLVITVLAIVAGTVISSIGDAEARAYDDLALAELAAVRDAVRRFRADTGFLPKTGPFQLVGDGNGEVPVPDEGPDWFYSPANLSQLYECPLPEGHPLAKWDVDRRRGWNGPYLTRGAEGWVVIGAGLKPDGSGHPAQGIELRPMPGVADPFLREPGPDPHHSTWPAWAFRWFPWGANHDDPSEAHTRRGRPVLLLDLHEERCARVVGFGSDGDYTPHQVQPDADWQAPAGDGDLGQFILK